MQSVYALMGNGCQQLELPPENTELLPGIPWGRFDELLTPAYWRVQAWQHDYLGTYRHTRLGNNLAEEIAACLLGGFGMKAELGLAAFARLRDENLLNAGTSSDLFERSLTEAFDLEGRWQRYRFPRQKARYLSACMKALERFDEPDDDLTFRNCLATFPGIGLKTASWIVRNHRASNAIAIIDIHILRAGKYIGIFSSNHEPQKHYLKLERQFLDFADAIKIPAFLLDSLMWDHMRRLSATLSGRTSKKRKQTSIHKPQLQLAV